MKTLPLFYYPSTCILVDDDAFLLSMMSSLFEKTHIIKTFSLPMKCLGYFENYTPPLSSYNFIESDLNDENHGLINKNPRNFDLTKIVKLREDKNRHNEVTVLVLDYQMPEMSGIELGQHLKLDFIQKILLTGNASNSEAIEGFNKDVIQKYIQKGDDKTRNNLLNYVKELSILYFSNITRPLLNYIETDKKTPLSDPVFIDFFDEFREKNKISEFYIIDINGSFFCITQEKKEIVLIVHTENSLNEIISLCRENGKFSHENIKAISEGGKIPFFGIGKEAWQLPSFDFQKNFHTSQNLDGREKYFYVILSDF